MKAVEYIRWLSVARKLRARSAMTPKQDLLKDFSIVFGQVGVIGLFVCFVHHLWTSFLVVAARLWAYRLCDSGQAYVNGLWPLT